MRDIGFWDILTGAIIPLVIGVLYVRRSRKIDTFNRTAEKFRAAFHDELVMLDPAMTICPNLFGLLSKAFNKHRAAIEEFLPVLRDVSRFDADGLEEAWNQYHRMEEYPDVHHNGLIQYEEITCGSKEAMRRKLLAKKRIERILYYGQNR
jgi:hypothetical protein